MVQIDLDQINENSMMLKKDVFEKEQFNELIINKTLILNKNEMKTNLFQYIWFLNDYEGEYIFCNHYKIRPKQGMFLLFPLSWCFPTKEWVSSETKRYFICGDIIGE